MLGQVVIFGVDDIFLEGREPCMSTSSTTFIFNAKLTTIALGIQHIQKIGTRST